MIQTLETINSVVMICPLCGSCNSSLEYYASSWEPSARSQKYEIRQCNDCRGTFTAPVLSPEILGSFYTRGLYGDTPNRFSGVVELISRCFQWMRLQKVRKAARPGRLLDVGCGKGSFLAYCARRGWDTWGIEPSRNGRKVAQSRLGERVVAEPRELPQSSEFDVVTLWHVLEHVDDPTAMLCELRSLIRPGGSILVCVPNIDALQSKLGQAAWTHLDVPRHRVHFSPMTLRNTLARAGYETLWIDHFLLEFGLLGIIQTALNMLGCEPGFMYSLVKRDTHPNSLRSHLRLVYSAVMALLFSSILLFPAFLLYLCEGAAHRGGAILACAVPTEEKTP